MELFPCMYHILDSGDDDVMKWKLVGGRGYFEKK